MRYRVTVETALAIAEAIERVAPGLSEKSIERVEMTPIGPVV